jgi:hypothetical protein
MCGKQRANNSEQVASMIGQPGGFSIVLRTFMLQLHCCIIRTCYMDHLLAELEPCRTAASAIGCFTAAAADNLLT